MGLLSNITGKGKTPDDADSKDIQNSEVLDDEPRNILLALISQLRMGMDLSKVTLPTFVLEPRSMLERVTDFMSHPDLIFGAGQNEDPDERFIQVLRYYLAGWHIKPQGVKKPYNPVLGEFFRCRYDYDDGTVGYFVAEQVSHHPPISAFAFFSPDNHLVIYGDLRPKSKFYGNSAATLMEGTSKVSLLDRPEDELYVISMPNMYARGLLFGRMVLELGDDSFVKNDANNISCDVEFKTKGYVSGTYNAIAGKINSKGKEIGDISGKWSDVMEIERCDSREVLFDAHNAELTPKTVTPESEQEEFESQRLWSDVTAAIIAKDLDKATEAKTKIEEAQRERAKLREANGEEFKPQFFVLKNDEYQPKILGEIPSDKAEANELVASFVYGNSSRPAVRTIQKE